MLNYVWAALILCAAIFAISSDVSDLRHDAFGNGRPIATHVVATGPLSSNGRDQPVTVTFTPAAYREHFGVDEPAGALPATLTTLSKGYQLRFADAATLPPRLATMRDYNDDKVLQAGVDVLPAAPAVGGAAIDAQLNFPAVRFVKLRAIVQAALDMAKTAVLTITFGLIGALALWLGLMRIAEACGLIEKMVKLIQPLLRPLFPDVPKNHPAMGYIAVNLAGNILGLGNATTAMGLKAMEELQTLNPDKETASDSMVMLLALHTAAFQLVPPATLIAVMGFSAMEVFVPMLLVGLIATAIAAVAAKLLGRLPMYRLPKVVVTPIQN
jgi:spore maturation protein A